MKLDAIGVVASDLPRAVAFYELLGFSFPAFGPEEQHVEAVTEPGAVRLMIDSAKLAEEILGEAPRPSNHSAFAILCDSPSEVDAAAAKIQAAGFTVVKEPWDAFWGQRYAIVADPDGCLVDLFARL